MKRIFYLSLLLVVPFLLHASHGRDKLNGQWISPYFNKQIKIKVKQHEVRVKGLSRNGWTTFTSIRRNVFEDCSGNRIKINNIHDLVYTNRYRGERIRFVKNGHNHRNHFCNSSCSIGDDFFTFFGHGQDYNDFYDDDDYDDWGYNNHRTNGRGNNGASNNNDWKPRNGNGNFSNNRIDGRYHVREIDEYVMISRTQNGLKARRGNENWVEYRQNKNRKNEYVDRNGNKFLMRNNGDLTWNSKNGKVSLNLQK